MKRGEVWRVRLPPASGHAQAGERPAIVIQDDKANLPTVLVVPFTATSAASRFTGTLIVHPDATNGLSVPSVALVFQLGAVDKRSMLYRLGSLDQATLDKVFAALDLLTGR